MSSVQPEAPPQQLLRSVEAFNRALRESSLGVSREVGCSKGTFAIVRILERRGTLQVSDIAHILRVDISVASRQVSQLVDDGLVESRVGLEDRRHRNLFLTAPGRALEQELSAAQRRRMRAAFSVAGPEAVHGFRKVLEQMIDADVRDRIVGWLESGRP